MWPDQKPLCLLQDVSTRWNSTLRMMHRVFSLFPAIVNVLVGEGNIPSGDSSTVARLLTAIATVHDDLPILIEILEPLRSVSDYAESSLGTLSAAVPLVTKLETHLQVRMWGLYFALNPSSSICIVFCWFGSWGSSWASRSSRFRCL